MQNPIGAIIVCVRPSDDADHGEVLTVRAGDGVEDAEAADGEGDNARADTASTCVAIGGIAGVELVAAADVGEARLGDEVVKEGEVEVAGDGEDVLDADLDEATGQVAAEGGVGCGHGAVVGGVAEDGGGGGGGGGGDAGVGGLR